MNIGSLTKIFSLKAAGAFALSGSVVAAFAQQIILPEIIKKESVSAPIAADKKVTPITVVAKKPAPQKIPSMFLHTKENAEAGYEIYTDGFCKEFAGECGGQGDATSLMYTEDTMRLLTNVNVGVNRAVEYKTDMEIFGTKGKFSYPVSTNGSRLQGDCEDYALEKRRILRQQGIPMETMMIALVKINATNENHAILIVRTMGGDFALDNRHDEVQSVRSLMLNKEYTFNSLSRPENDKIVSSIVAKDDSDDLRWINRYAARPAQIPQDIPSAESVQLALENTVVKGDPIVVFARLSPQTTTSVMSGLAPTATP